MHSPLRAGRMFFRCFENPDLSMLFYPVSICFLPSFAIIFGYIFSSHIVCFDSITFSFLPKPVPAFFLCFIILIVVVDFLSAFPDDFPIQVFSFRSCTLGEHQFLTIIIIIIIKPHCGFFTSALSDGF